MNIGQLMCASFLPQIYRDNSEILMLEDELKSKGLVKIEDAKQFTTSTVWNYRNTLNFAIKNGRLPKI